MCTCHPLTCHFKVLLEAVNRLLLLLPTSSICTHLDQDEKAATDTRQACAASESLRESDESQKGRTGQSNCSSAEG